MIAKIIPKWNRWVTSAGLVVVMLSGAFTAFPFDCDPLIEEHSIDNWTLKYRKRDNRCEGIYRSDVSIGVMDVVGTTVGAFHFATHDHEMLEISSPVVANRTINIRAVGVPLKTYYRMDAELGPDQTLKWPVGDVILRKKLSDRDIGVFGWIKGDLETVYVPIAVSSKSSPALNDGKKRIYLRSSVELEAVKWRATINPGNIACNRIPDNVWRAQEWRDLKQTNYFAGRSIEIVLPPSKAEEICIQTAGRSDSGQWIFNWSRIILSQGGN
jgi:hypothetical protein